MSSSTSGIYVIEVMTTNVLTLDSDHNRVLDTACGAHILSTVHGLRNRKVRKEEIDMCVDMEQVLLHLPYEFIVFFFSFWFNLRT